MDPITLIVLVICCVGLVALVGIAGYFLTTYNGLVRLRILVEEGWSGIDVQLKKRYDLIPNLVNTVKGYAKHEQQVLENVTKFRNAAMNAGSVEEKIEAENMLSSTLKTLFSVTESYPDLKADASFLNLQSQLTAVEGDLEKARRYYNGTVRDFNGAVQVFPASVVAGLFRFQSKPFFEAEAGARENVVVDFNN